jgi:uncharacterized repeat protein (TIGR03809 family)
MPKTPGAPRLDEIIHKWRDLADRRLDYFTELYRSGRWKHYYTRERFATRMLDVIKAVKVWGELAERASAEQVLVQQSAARDDGLRSAA